MKKLLVFVSFFLIFIQFYHPVFSSEYPPNYITFINQVRGGECCDPGSLSNLNLQLKSFQDNSLSATFAIRYDALKDDQFTSVLKNSSHQIAGLLEIIPSLANDSGVSYSGTKDYWYLSKHAFLVGYELTDRKKLIDTYMSQFKAVFGVYPTTTSSWMIDSYSLNYLKETYDVSVHQITRDQWGTDTYTLYGGPFHYPYFASSNWPLIPGDSQILIVRQTVADPLYNYADNTSSHTSQPNDYLQDKDFKYFENLLTQTLNQNHNQYSFALLGLENSMDDIYQNEFINQISWVKNYQDQNPNTHIVKASELPSLLPQPSTSIISGKDLVSNNKFLESFHINSSSYSARIIRKNNSIFITDFRIYSENFSDITATNSSPTNNTYWIAPFIIDSSRMVPPSKPNLNNIFKKISNLIFPKLPNFPIFNPKPDYKSDQLIGIKLPDIIKNGLISIDNQTISYQSSLNTSITISIEKNRIKINQPDSAIIIGDQDGETPFSMFPQIKKVDNNSLSWNGIYQIQISSEDGETIILPTTSTENVNITNLSVAAFYPDLISSSVNPEKSFTILHNRVALASQNPIRLFIYPIGEDGIPTINQNISISSNNSSDQIKIHLPTKNTDMTWADIFSNSTGNRTITIKIDNQQIDTQSVYFALNCKNNLLSCLKKPKDMIIYVYYQVITIIKKLSQLK